MAKINPSTNIPSEASTDQQWINWHGSAKSRYGKKTANILFMEAWQKRMSSDSNTVALRNYLENQGIKVESGVLNYTADLFDSWSDSITGWFGFSKTIFMVIIIASVLAVIAILYQIAKNPGETARVALAARTGGKSLN